MKSLRQYLTESVRTYHYTIKILGDTDKNFLDLFRYNLNKFDPVKIEDPKTTPIQKNPYGFTDSEPNQSVTIFKAEFKYPATEPMIQQVAQQCGCNINKVRAVTTDYNDSINAENDKYANEMDSEDKKALLDQEQLADNGKQASKDYANQYLDRVIPKEPSIDIPFAAKKTPSSPNTSKEGIQTVSPLSKVKMPDRPQTGARK
jgi:hypothetical protein